MRVLAVTVDPETDDPAKLRELRDRHDLDAARWTLLTGPPDELRSLLQSGFALAVGEKQETAPGVFEIAHSAKLALLDQDGGVRGFYDSDERGLDELYWRAQHVLREQRREAGRAGRR
jgi:protein SCO1/2